MGSCLSICQQDPGSARFRLAMGAKAGEILAPPPVMGGVYDRNSFGAGGFNFKSMPESAGVCLGSLRFDTKDESFFESRECFQSDCEDDFFSVNGDFTPSRGSTPIHHMVSPIKLQQHNRVAPLLDELTGARSESPPTKKTLAQLLLETTTPGQSASYERNTADRVTASNGKWRLNKTIKDQLATSPDETPYLSPLNCIDQTTPERYLENVSEKTRGKTKHWCLPGLVPRLSTGDRKPPSPWGHRDG